MRRPQKILHAPTNIANMAWLFAVEQRKRGYIADVVVKTPAKRGFKYDIDLKMSVFQKQSVKSIVRRMLLLTKFIFTYDIYFFYYGESLSSLIPFLPNHWDLPLLRLMGKKILMFTNGSDVIPEKAVNCATFKKRGCKECYKCEDRRIKEKNINNAKRHVHVLFSSCRCIEFTRNGSFDDKINEEIINPVDPKKFPFIGIRKLLNGEAINIVHAPSRLNKKGTDTIKESIERLIAENFKINFMIIHNVEQNEAKRLYEKADIIIDHVNNGWYGSFSLEAMALGKPLLTNIRKDLIERYKIRYDKTPIVNVNEDNLYQKIKMIIQNQNDRDKKSLMGRRYVEDHHTPEKIVDTFEKVLEKL